MDFGGVWRYNTRVMQTIGIGIVQNSKGQVVIVERKKKEKGTGNKILTWVFPGGEPASYETVQQGVEREVCEETGYEVLVHEKISERNHPEFPVLIKYFRCELKTDEQVELVDVEEIAQVKWVKPEELKDYFTTDLDPGVSQFLRLS